MSDSPSSATPLMLLPGLICDAHIWAPQVDALRADRPVIAIDGYGESDSVEAMAQSALAHAPDRFILVGHSMGGRVALEILRRAPERVVGLGLISTGVHSPKPNEAEGRFALLARGVEEGHFHMGEICHCCTKCCAPLVDWCWPYAAFSSR